MREPKKGEAAINNSENEKWQNTLQEELTVLKENVTCSLQQLPEGAEITETS